MKVIHILHELKYSGAEIMYVDAASIFQAKGCELTVVATAPDVGEYAPYFEKAGYKVYHKPYPPLKKYFSRIKFFRKFTRFLKEEKYEVVHIHSQMWGMSLCAWLAGIKSIYTFHNNFPTNKHSHLYHILLRWTSKHIFKCRFQTISDSVYDHELKLYHNQTTKIYNWYSNKKFYPAQPGEQLSIRKELGISEDALVLISIGGCSPVKRHSDIIKALPIIMEKVPNCVYLHLGKGDSEDSEKAMVEEMNLQDHVIFCGNQREVRKYHIASDIYIMPSKFEGIPISTIEAMGSKMPCILYDVPGLRDFNKDGENSMLIPEDHTLIAEKAIQLFEHKQMAEQIAGKGFAFVNNYFSMEKNASLIYEMYL